METDAKKNKTNCLSVGIGRFESSKYDLSKWIGSELSLTSCLESDVMQTFNYTEGKHLKNDFAEGYVVRSDSQPFMTRDTGVDLKLKKDKSSEDVFIQVDKHGVQCLGHDGETVLWKTCSWDDESLRWLLQEGASPTIKEWTNFGTGTTDMGYRLTVEANTSICASSDCKNAKVDYKLGGCKNRDDFNDFVANGLQTMNDFKHDCPKSGKPGAWRKTGSVRGCMTAEETNMKTREEETNIKPVDDNRLDKKTRSLRMAECYNLRNQHIIWIGSASSYHAVVETKIETKERSKWKSMVNTNCADWNFWRTTCLRYHQREEWNEKTISEPITYEKRCLEVMGELVSIMPCASTPSQRWTAIPW